MIKRKNKLQLNGAHGTLICEVPHLLLLGKGVKINKDGRIVLGQLNE